ncbi:tetratricopeptide repeat protein [Roseovarius aestuarii]|uniref:Lipoprotein NlpI n=1 Tax=Roseovarius aestuarii TaxID=475083 RepID=A0A1X7BTC0_9RHOB|nr:tetratricopeptide repeat protein [Roseovarius aestuarii]SMC12911.1 lipoprotein NlpI [Roseovarius aestuarii]
MKLRSLSIAVLAAALQLPTGPPHADEAVGAYLAARQARFQNDFTAAAEHFTRALAKDPSNPALMENAIAAYVGLGQLEKALPVAQRIEDADLLSQVAHMVLFADEGRREAYDELLDRIDRNRGIGELGDGLIAAWAHMGQGDMKTALELFDKVADQRGLHSFANYHKALALASVGDFESAEAIFSGDAEGPMQRTRRGTMAWAQVLSQLEHNDEAVAVIDEVFGGNMDPEITELRERLAADERLPFSVISGARDGVSEVFFSLGRALQVDAGQDYVLLYARVAEYLTPDNVDAVIMTAELLETLERHELATTAYRRVPRDHPSYYIAELGRAEALRRSDKADAAIEVLEQLSQSHGNLPIVHVSTGDLHRQLEQFEKAAAAYDRALALYEERDNNQWFVYYARGISHERLDEWEDAEADFRKALELSPEQPQVLNYLGYSMVEKRINLDEALDMIERAVAARPDSGYIIDSLGWVLYRLGRYDEAVGHMERAAELEPVDPVVNDHLGDVLWAVGRYQEAEFQWHRALSFVSEGEASSDVEADRIRRKLEVGLDEVLKEEGSAPLKVVDDGG